MIFGSVKICIIFLFVVYLCVYCVFSEFLLDSSNCISPALSFELISIGSQPWKKAQCGIDPTNAVGTKEGPLQRSGEPGPS